MKTESRVQLGKALFVGALLGWASLAYSGVDVRKSNGAWISVRAPGDTVYKGPDYYSALTKALSGLRQGRTTRDTVRVHDSGVIVREAGANTLKEIRVPSHTLLDFKGNTLRVQDSGLDDATIPLSILTVKNVEVRDAKITGNPRYAIWIRGSREITLTRPYISIPNARTLGLGIRIAGWSGMPSAQIRIDRAVIDGAKDHGIETADVDSIYIGTVVSRNTGGCGLLFNKTRFARVDSVLAENASWGGGYAGLRFANSNGPDLKVNYLRAKRCGRGLFGVSVNHGIHIKKVEIDETSGHGILLQSTSDITIDEGYVRNAGNEGIRISSQTMDGINYPSSRVHLKNLRVFDDRAVPVMSHGVRETCSPNMTGNVYDNLDVRGAPNRPADSSAGCADTRWNALLSAGSTTPQIRLTATATTVGPDSPVVLAASVPTSYASLAMVEIFRDGQKVSTANTWPWTFTFKNIPTGQYRFTARGVDHYGVATTSAPVTVTIEGNKAPTISMTKTRATLTAPASIAWTWKASDSDGTLNRVELLQNNVGVNWLPQGARSSTTGTFSVTGLQPGVYRFAPKVVDNLGKVVYGTTETYTVTWDYALSTSGAGNWFGGLYIGYKIPAGTVATARILNSSRGVVKTITITSKTSKSRFTSVSGQPAGTYTVQILIKGVVVASKTVVKI